MGNVIMKNNVINENAVIVIPALNPDCYLVEYIEKLIENGARDIIVVNDGSSDEYKEVFEKIEKIGQCMLVNHEINLGKGRALKNAMSLYKEKLQGRGYAGIITVDADGQHTVEDVAKVSKKMNECPESLILGERDFDKDVPLRSKFGNVCTSFIFKLLYKIKLHDTQTGLRGIPNKYLEIFSKLEGDRYEYEMNMLMACSRNKISIESVSIQTIYNDNNQSSHFRPLVDSFKIYKLIFGTFFKYTFVSLSSFVIDILLFRFLIFLFYDRFTNIYILLSTIIARICSSLFNFIMNKKVVFKSDEKTIVTITKYYILCVVQMLASAILVSTIYKIVPFSETVVKMVVDTLLFLVSYRIQNNLIFKKNR